MASFFPGVVTGTNLGQGYHGDHLFTSSGFGITHGLACETDLQNSVSEVGGEDLSITGGLLDRGPGRCGSNRGQREVAVEFSVPDSEGMVLRLRAAALRTLRSSMCVWTKVWWNLVTPCAVTLLACVP